MYKMRKAIAVLILTPMVILIITAIFSMLVEEGIIIQVWLTMVTKIPFGGQLAELATTVFTEAFGTGYDMSKYTLGATQITLLQILEDVCRLMLAGVWYEAVNGFVQNFLGVWKKKSGIHNILMQMASSMVSIVFCTFLATWITDLLYAQIAQLPGFAQGIISTVVSVVTLVGAYGVIATLFGATLLGTLIYVGIDMLLVNVLKVLASYEAILLIVMFINEGAYMNALAALSAWGVVIVILVGIDLMMSGIIQN